MRRWWRWYLTGVVGGLALTAAAPEPGPAVIAAEPDPPYDGRYVFVRLRYAPYLEPAGCRMIDGTAGPGWGHDSPRAEQNLITALTALTTLTAPAETTLALTAADPELLRYPIAYLSEPGCWNMTAAEAQALGAYLQKGGFLIVDDLTFGDGTPEHTALAVERLTALLRRVLPEGRLQRLAPAEPLFGLFFAVDPREAATSAQVEQLRWAPPAEFWGIYEGNDPARRLLVVASYHTSLAQRWRWAVQGVVGLAAANTPYKLGVNYVLYGLTH